MPIIYTYPVKSTANDNDLILISDSQDSNKTKQIKIGDLPGGSSSGVSSVTATLPVVSSGGNTPVISLKDLTGFGTAGQVIKVNSGADGLEWGAAGGSTSPGGSDHSVQYKDGSAFAGGNDLTFHPTNNIFSVKHTVIVKGQGNGNPAGRLKLNCEQDSHAITLEGPAHSGGADYTLKFPSGAPGTSQILEYENSTNNLRWIATPTSSGATPAAGATGQVQYNDGSNGFAASANITIGGTPNVLTVKNIVQTRGDGTNAGKFKIWSNDNLKYVSIEGPPNGGTDYDIKMPNAVGTANQVLKLPSTIPGSGASQLVWGDAGTSYTLPLATNSIRGGIKVAGLTRDVSPLQAPSTDSSRDYQVQINTNASYSEQLFVNVPWTDTQPLSYSAGTGLSLSTTTFSLATGAALTNLGGGSGTTYLRKDGTWQSPSSTAAAVGHCSVDWADGCDSFATGNLIRLYRFTNSADFTTTRGWVFITNNSGGGSETPLTFSLGLYSGTNMGTINGLTLLGSGTSSNNPSTGLLAINLTAASGYSLALNKGSHYFLALMAKNSNSGTAVAGRSINTAISSIANYQGNLPGATSLPTSLPAEGQSFSLQNYAFACTLV